MLAPSVRVPMIARWPGRFTPGARCGIPTTNLDLWPTFLGAAGHPEPVVDPEGESLLDVAHRAESGAGTGMPPVHGRYVYSQQGQGAYGLYLITDGRWAYSYSAADEKEWVYDLVTDPGETRNLAYNPLYQRQVHRLRETLIGRLETGGSTVSGHNIAIENGGWRRYGVRTLNPDPDYGLLIPHPEGLARRIADLGEGYARDVFVSNEEAFKLLDQAAKYRPDLG
jgi:arylsulfatase